MNDEMKTFENDVRAMLRRRAADVDGLAGRELSAGSQVRLPNQSPGHRSHRILLSAAAVVALVAVVGVGLVFRDDDSSIDIYSSAPTSVPQELPTWFDPATAAVVFDTRYDEPQDAAEDYLRARFPDFPAQDVGISHISVDDGLATAQWAGQEPEYPYRGEIVLRLVDDSWDVVASTTEGVYLSGLERRDGVIEGKVTSEGTDMLALDVLGLDGEPVEDAPEPNGFPGAAYRFGTAGVSDDVPSSMAIEVPASIEVGDEPVIVRVQHVGGTLLSVTEVVFPGPGSEPSEGSTAPTSASVPQAEDSVLPGYFGGFQSGVSFRVGETSSVHLAIPTGESPAPIVVSFEPQSVSACPTQLQRDARCDMSRFLLVENVYLWIDYAPTLVPAILGHKLEGEDPQTWTLEIDVVDVASRSGVPISTGRHCVAVVGLEDDGTVVRSKAPDHGFVSMLSMAVGVDGTDWCSAGLESIPAGNSVTLPSTSDGSDATCSNPILLPHGVVPAGQEITVEVGSCPGTQVVAFIAAAPKAAGPRDIYLSKFPASPMPVVQKSAVGVAGGDIDRKGRAFSFQLGPGGVSDRAIFMGRLV